MARAWAWASQPPSQAALQVPLQSAVPFVPSHLASQLADPCPLQVPWSSLLHEPSQLALSASPAHLLWQLASIFAVQSASSFAWHSLAQENLGGFAEHSASQLAEHPWMSQDAAACTSAEHSVGIFPEHSGGSTSHWKYDAVGLHTAEQEMLAFHSHSALSVALVSCAAAAPGASIARPNKAARIFFIIFYPFCARYVPHRLLSPVLAPLSPAFSL